MTRPSKKKPATMTWRPTVEDVKLMTELRGRLGVTDSDVIRIGLRRLAEAEGLNSK